MRALGLLLCWLVVLPISAQAGRMFHISLEGLGPETQSSWARPSGGSTAFYGPNLSMTLELPTDPATGGFVSGIARLHDFLLPSKHLERPGFFFQLTSAPSVLEGSFEPAAGGSEGGLHFAGIPIGFRLGTSSAFARNGIVLLDLTTGGVQVPGGCDGDQPSGFSLSGQPIDLGSLGRGDGSGLRLVAAQCPYSTEARSYQNAFQFQVVGEVPEPGTGLLAVVGLSILAAWRRNRR